MNFVRCPVFKSLVGSLPIVKLKVFFQACPDFWNILIIVQKHIFIFHGSPKAFHKNIVESASPSIHAEANPSAQYNIDKLVGRKLHPLVGIENYGFSVPLDCFLDSLYAKRAVQTV
jgi:hypothetical protein